MDSEQGRAAASGQRPPHKPAKWFAYTSAASIGLEMAVAIVLCTMGAWWIESHFTHWAPWTMIIGFMVGVGGAANAIFRTIRQHEAEVAARREGTDGEP